MKKLLLFLFAFAIIFNSFTQTQKNNYDFKLKPYIVPTVDLSVLTATTAYWIFAEKVEPDKVIHFLFGYFATSAMNYILKPLDLPKGLKIGVPILVFGGLAVFKELSDSQFELRDFYAGMLGCGISAISFNLTYTIKYK